MKVESGRRRHLPRSFWVAVLLWVAVTASAVIWGVPHEEDHLTERATQALSGQSLEVEFAGRDARISGEVAAAADLDRAVATVHQVRGVRRVDGDSVQVAADSTRDTVIEPSPPDLRIVFDGPVATVSGTVPDRTTADAIIRAAHAKWGSSNVVDRIVVGPNTSGAAWLAGIASAISGVDNLATGAISVGGGGVRVEGPVASEDIRTTIVEGLAAAFGSGIVVDDQLHVVTFDEPSFEAELLEDGTVRLRGVLPDRATVDAIAAAAAGNYGSARVDNEMIVGTSISSPDYLRALPSIFGAIDGLNPWRINVGDGHATIAGLAVSDDAIDATVGRLTATLGTSGISLDNQLEFNPTAVATVLTDLLKGTATFEVGSAVLSAEAMELLDSAIEILGDNPTTVLTVEGHTDDVGSDEDNMTLSEDRAQAVVDFLVAGGVDAARLAAVGYGESRPIADNGTAEGRAENRRIQFVVEQGDS